MSVTESAITFRKREDGTTRVEMVLGGECVSWLEIVPFTIRIGSAEVRMDGIGEVNTLKNHRMRGYSRRVMEAAVEHMTRGDAAISMLYGIGNFYHKFGYATAGPDYYILTDLDTFNEIPEVWSVRPFAVDDLPAVRRIYNEAIRTATGASVRSQDDNMWKQMLRAGELRGNDCRVIVGPDARVHAYAWLAQWCYTVEECFNESHPDALVIGETIADSPASADALLAACREWTSEKPAGRDTKQLLLIVPPDTHVAAAAMYQNASLIQGYEANAASMIRVLDVKRLLEALSPEILARLKAVNSTFDGTLTIHTGIGSATLVIGPDDVRVEDRIVEHCDLVVEMPQMALGRLAIGALSDEDILDRLPVMPDDQARELLLKIFPSGYPHMYAPERY